MRSKMRWWSEHQAPALVLLVALVSSSACQARSAEEQQIASRYPDSFYMYAGAACEWRWAKRVEWPNAIVDDGIHRWSVRDLSGGEEVVGAYELYTDDRAWAPGDLEKAQSRGLPLKVRFSGWVAGCKDDPNEVAIADSITLAAEK